MRNRTSQDRNRIAAGTGPGAIELGLRNKISSLMAETCSTSPFDRRIWIPYGDGGTAATIDLMARQATLGSRDILVRLMAVEIMNGVPGRNHKEVAERFFSWLQDNGSGERSGVKFINDPYRTEQVRLPWWTLTVEGAGDCNSAFATTIAALLLSVGIPCFFRTVAADSRRPDSFSHVYTCAVVNGRELPLDPSVPFSRTGSEPTEIYKKRDWPIDIFDQADRKPGLFGWLRGIF